MDSLGIHRQQGVPPETRREYLPVGSYKTSVFCKVSGGTPYYRRIARDLYRGSFDWMIKTEACS